MSARAASSIGKLFLIGAGPGDPELITVKAVRALAQADVILYDRLVNEQLLEYARPDAAKIYVGKHHGEQEHTQNEIFDLILRHTLDGKTVARLKGGDPIVFGRGAEEWALAVEHGVPVQLIPGITSAIAVPSLAGIPLTYRGVSQSFAVVTGHCQEGAAENWSRYAEIDTLVILMGIKNRALIAKALIEAGRDAAQPVAFIEKGTSSEERLVASTLAEVARNETEVRNPAVFVIGEVVRLRGKLIVNEQAPEAQVPVDLLQEVS